jgi:uncharacterized protein (DUF58 family)
MSGFGAVLTSRGRAFVASGLTLLVAGFGLGFADLSRVGVLLVALPLLTGALARRRPDGIRVARVTTPARIVADESADVQVTVDNLGTRSTPIMLAEERLDYVLGERPRVVLGALLPGDSRTMRYTVRPPVRGRHRLGPLAVSLRDPYGLTSRFLEIGGVDHVLALPRSVPLRRTRPPGAGVGAEGSIPHMVALHGEDDQSVREYRDGDDLRRIHWRATARAGELMVRQEDRPARHRAVILLDSRADAHRGSGAGASFEWAVSAAASILVHLGDIGYAVHLVSPETVSEGNADVGSDLAAALEALALATPAPLTALTDLSRATQTLMAGGGLLIALVAGHDESAVRKIATLRVPGGTGLALVLHPGSFTEHPERDSAPEGADTAYVRLFRAAGWQAVGVDAGTPITDAWDRLTSGHPARVDGVRAAPSGVGASP